MSAFAANLLLCRRALTGRFPDPVTLTGLRLVAGALFLAKLVAARRSSSGEARPSWRAVLAMWANAAACSEAYFGRTVGTGALSLCGAVQLTMIATGLAGGERFAPSAHSGPR
ncbi:MAG: hypothetical protein R3F49_10970 [Planctomycetota bacterium]